MEGKELIVRKKNYGYAILTAVFILSVVGSIIYFSGNHKAKKSETKIAMISGESGEIIFSDVNVLKDNELGNDSNAAFQNENMITENSTEKNESTTYQNQNLNDYKVVSQNENASNNNTTLKNESEVNDNTASKNESTATGNNISTVTYKSNRKLDANKPMVALTFDDGPDPKRTQQIIDILNEYNVRASFFDIGNLMERYPETLKAEVNSGADVGGHTYSHVNLNNLSKEEINEEISKMEDVFKSITGQELKYVRPTYGNANELVRQTVKHPLINWCVDSLDWKSRDTDKILEEIYKTENFDGKIIILHVIYDTTVEATKKLVPDLINRGYQLVTISEMAEYKGVTLENGKVYYQF